MQDNVPETTPARPRVSAVYFEPPRFSGTGDLNNFLRLFKKSATRNGWDESMWVKFLPAYLDGLARDLWDGLSDEDEPATWDEAVERLFLFFPFEEDIDAIESQLFNKRQAPGESYVKFEQDTLALTGRLGREVSEKEKIRIIMRGLSDNIYQYVFMADPQDLKELSQAAMRYERSQSQLVQRRINDSNQRSSRRTMPTSGSSVAASGGSWNFPSQRLSSGIEPRRPNAMRTSDGRPICFSCSKEGHVARYCPELRRKVPEFQGN